MNARRSFRLVLVAAGMMLLGAATTSVASAATLRSTADGLRYTTTDAATLSAVTAGRDLILTDAGASELSGRLPANCASEPAAQGIVVRCDAPGAQVLRLDLSASADTVAALELPRRVALIVRAGDGDNVVEGGAGDDQLLGGAARDTFYGGPGADVVDGKDGSNYLRGNGGDDVLRGGAEIDFLIGDGGDDVIRGAGGIDFIDGGGGNDYVDGGAGFDDIGGGNGDDTLIGGADDDELRGGRGADRMLGGGGDDLIRARDGERDTIDCGSGSADIARIDAGEIDEARRSCETVRQADAAIAEPVDVNAPAVSVIES